MHGYSQNFLENIYSQNDGRSNSIVKDQVYVMANIDMKATQTKNYRMTFVKCFVNSISGEEKKKCRPCGQVP